MRYFKLILFTLLILTFASGTVSAENPFPASNLFYNSRGALNLEKVCQRISSGNLSISNVKVYTKNNASGDFFEVPGHWLSSKIGNCDGLSGYGTFQSDEGVFIDPGIYTIYVNHTYSGNSRTSIVGEIKYPGVEFTCSLVKISIDKCYKKDAFLYVLFNAEGIEGQSSNPNAIKVDLYEDIFYSIGTEEGKGLGDWSLSGNTTFKKINANQYLFQSTVNIDAVIKDFSMNLDSKFGCSDYSQTYDEIECTGPPLCERNEDCFKDEYCSSETGYCEKLVCSANESIRNHTCASCLYDSQCNDNNMCTEDECLNYKCVHYEITCESEDVCLVGRCIPSEGCKYAVNETCVIQRAGGELKGEDKTAFYYPYHLLGMLLVAILIIIFLIFRMKR